MSEANEGMSPAEQGRAAIRERAGRLREEMDRRGTEAAEPMEFLHGAQFAESVVGRLEANLFETAQELADPERPSDEVTDTLLMIKEMVRMDRRDRDSLRTVEGYQAAVTQAAAEEMHGRAVSEKPGEMHREQFFQTFSGLSRHSFRPHHALTRWLPQAVISREATMLAEQAEAAVGPDVETIERFRHLLDIWGKVEPTERPEVHMAGHPSFHIILQRIAEDGLAYSVPGAIDRVIEIAKFTPEDESSNALRSLCTIGRGYLEIGRVGEAAQIVLTVDELVGDNPTHDVKELRASVLKAVVKQGSARDEKVALTD